MKNSLLGGGAFVTVVLLLAAACGGGASSDDAASGPVMSDLAPTYSARPDAEQPRPAQAKKAERRRQARRDAARAGDREAGSAAAEPASDERAQRQDASAPAHPATLSSSAPVLVDDPSGDLSRSVERAPASADIVAVRLVRRGGSVEVRTTFAGAVPTRQTGEKGMNVASFYDVDDNGIVDYEVWTSLADNGWGTGYLDRREEKATFGPSTGIRVSVEGDTLVTRFPVSRLGGAEAFRWSAASEWGSYASMSSSTSARDYAPDRGAVDYPARR
jgi:hypothetical protein